MSAQIDLKDYEGLYVISSDGVIRRTGKLVPLTVSNRGTVSLRKNGANKEFYLAELVYVSFVDPHWLEHKRKIHFKDNDKYNFAASNLTCNSVIADIPGEIWKEWQYPYEISSYGRVRNIFTDVLMKIAYGNHDIANKVALSSKEYRVEELVAATFLNWKSGPISHIDGDMSNDNVSNLVVGVCPPSVEDEVWKDVVGYEGRYMISSKGRFYTVPRKEKRGGSYVTIHGRILNADYDQDGYLRITLTGDNQSRFDAFLHRLVAQTFIPNPEGLPQVNHKDGIKTNNCVDNLEWVSNQQNVDHAWRAGLNDNRVENNPLTIPLLVDGQYFESIAAAARFLDVDEESLRLYVHGRTKSVRGLSNDVNICKTSKRNILHRPKNLFDIHKTDNVNSTSII